MATRTRLKGGILAAAIALVGGFEGLRLAAYRDIVGVPTICYGETRGVKMGDRATKEQCDAMLGDGLREFEQGVRACLDRPDAIPDGAYIASLSLAYNIGQRAFCGSTLAKKLNAGDYVGACGEFPKWNRAGGRVVKGLVNRRAEERELCLEGLPARSL